MRNLVGYPVGRPLTATELMNDYISTQHMSVTGAERRYEYKAPYPNASVWGDIDTAAATTTPNPKLLLLKRRRT